MNKKLLASAVSAVLMGSAGIAAAEVTVYGRINNAIDLNDLHTAGDGTTRLTTVVSRLGVRANKSLGNGVTVHGQYEFGVVSDREERKGTVTVNNTTGATVGGKEDGEAIGSGSVNTGPFDVRVASAGISGAFGRVDVGNLWTAYNGLVGTLISPTYSLGYYLYSSIGGGLFRSSNTIQYSNSWGPIDLKLDVRLNDDGNTSNAASASSDNDGSDVAEKARGDGWGLAVNWNIRPNIKVAAAYDVEADRQTVYGPGTFAAQDTPNDGILATYARGAATIEDRELFAIAGRWDFGHVWVSAGFQLDSSDQDEQSITVAANIIDANDDGDATDNSVLTAANQFNGSEDAFNETATTNVVTVQERDDRTSLFVYAGGPFGAKTSWMLGYGGANDGVAAGQVSPGGTTLRSETAANGIATGDSNQFIWALYHNVGGGLRLYYEAVGLDNENAGRDGERHFLGMRVDF